MTIQEVAYFTVVIIHHVTAFFAFILTAALKYHDSAAFFASDRHTVPIDVQRKYFVPDLAVIIHLIAFMHCLQNSLYHYAYTCYQISLIPLLHMLSFWLRECYLQVLLSPVLVHHS